MSPPGERVLLVLLAYIMGGLGYLAVNHVVGAGPFRHLAIPLDAQIPFVPNFVFFYVLAYVTPAIGALFIRDRAEMYRTFLAFSLNAVICFSIFFLFPIEYPRMEALPDTLAGRILGLVHGIDRPVNCFPSHHIGTATTAALAVWRQNRRWGIVFAVIAGLIAVSTLFVKQHYVLDVLAGFGVAALTYALSYPAGSPARPETN